MAMTQQTQAAATRDDLIARAGALVPDLKRRAPATELFARPDF
jgi:hypothetical protein